MIGEQSYEEGESCDNIDRYVKNYVYLQPMVSRSHILNHTSELLFLLMENEYQLEVSSLAFENYNF